ncbi:hypothetical protein [Frankia sp. CIT1]|uniref:hypothetical protein n=1 Tax=Frankia sp. CIT1 TaxID=2880974 RepID=UPI001EF42991|nr:hypothetical protein [Frankia sp. CIT1]
MGDSSVAITAGSGTAIDTYQLTGGDHQQVVRLARASAITHGAWTIDTTASTSQIAADDSRVVVIMKNASTTATVYLRYDSTAPTSSVYHVDLGPGERYEVPLQLSTRAISMLGSTASGTLLYALGTAA